MSSFSAPSETLLADLLLSLAEFDRVAAYRELGFATLFDYLHRELHLSRGSAHYRKVATRLVVRFPEIVEPIRDGRLCLTTVIVVARVMTEENRYEVFPRFFGLLPPGGGAGRGRAPAGRGGSPGDGRDRGTVCEVGGGRRHPAMAQNMNEYSRSIVELAPARTLRRADDRHGDPPPHHRLPRVPGAAQEGQGGEVPPQPRCDRRAGADVGAGTVIEKQGKRKASVPAKVKREVVKRDGGGVRGPWRTGAPAAPPPAFKSITLSRAGRAARRRPTTAESSASPTTSKPRAGPTETRNGPVHPGSIRAAGDRLQARRWRSTGRRRRVPVAAIRSHRRPEAG